MRKTLLALIFVIPMVFVIVLFVSTTGISLQMPPPVSGIELRSENAGEDGSIFIDMANDPHATVTAEVQPINAAERGYTLSSSDTDVADVTKDGLIVPKGEGTAEIVATSNDKGFTDSLPVVVVSSKPYALGFSLKDAGGNAVPLIETEEGYRGTVPTGSYTYDVAVHPAEFNNAYAIGEVNGVFAQIERGTRSIFLPFSGKAEFNVFVQEGVAGMMEKKVSLTVEKSDPDGVIINGQAAEGDDAFGGVSVTKGTTETTLYVESSSRPIFRSDKARANISGRDGRYTVDITFNEGVDGETEDDIEATLVVSGKTYPFLISFTEFAFSVFSDNTLTDLEDGSRQATILTGTSVSFYAVASGGAKGVEYTWVYSGPAEDFAVEGGTATLKAKKSGDYTLSVRAVYRDRTEEELLHISIINNVSVVQINNDVKCDLAERYTVAGLRYTSALRTEENVYPLLVFTYSTSGVGSAGDDIAYTVSDERVASVEIRGGSPVLIPKGTGAITVTAAWKGNEAFGRKVQGTIKLNVVKEAVAVQSAPELVAATDAALPVVLTKDIKLGTNAAGEVLSAAERENVLKSHRMKSTYNIEWYKNSKDAGEDGAYVSYVLEFKASVYGNGKHIDAGNYTHAVDDAGQPLFSIYRDPLYFVNYKQMASVAGQDNCAFLIRTDGVKLYGVNLLGCSDDLLADENGTYDLTQLNHTGTTLEVNASAEIVNCRIRNGRNVIRAYGGNRNGNKYFIDNLSENAAGVDSERIHVTIDGCILAQGREFILKIGANKALRANRANGQEPAFKDAQGNVYNDTNRNNVYGGGKLYEDEWFYKQYVMTDVILKNSVLETSGLFTVGVESNFAGEFLYEGASDHQWRNFTREWERSGGTSFASVLRLQGDVRLYDWKDITLINSSTLIESPTGVLSGWLKLDIASMIEYVTKVDPTYNTLIEPTSDEKKFVHGGIAFYGGGRNYSCFDTTGLNGLFSDFTHVNINISVLADAGGNMTQQGELLPRAAGTHDFNFYMYGKDSENNYLKQRSDEQRGIKYKGVTGVPLFEE